ncbi:MAG: hypothetical protein QXS20_02845 [Candidatus Thorarchaeota archaeon]
MKLFYRVDPAEYPDLMRRIRDKFGLHEDIDEEKTMLNKEDQSQIETVVGSYDPTTDNTAQVRVVLNDPSLREEFDAILGEPYLIK